MATVSSIITSMINFIKGKNATIDTSVGTLFRDIVVECPANEINSVYTEIDSVQKISAFFTYPEDLTTQEMDDVAANYGLTRGAAVVATGQVRFIKYTAPTSAITIAAGTVVSTSSSSGAAAVSFVTTAEATLSTSPNYDPVNNYYYVDAFIESSTAGSVGNVGSGTITSFGTVTGLDLVTNPLPTSGGSDAESNTSLAGRIQTKLMGNNYGTTNGYISLVNTSSSISEVAIIGPNDPNMKRSLYGGKVDIGIRPASVSAGLTTYSENFSYISSQQTYNLTKQPARTITTVTGTYLGSPYTFNSATTDYSLLKDTGANSGSVRALDKINWDGAKKPDDPSTFTVTYTYFSATEDAQANVDNDLYHTLTADALVREAESVSLIAAFSVVKLSGYSVSEVSSSVSTAFANYVNALLMGATIDESDLVAAIYTNATGVDSIILPFTTFQKTDSTGTTNSVNGRLTITKVQYFKVGSLTITVS